MACSSSYCVLPDESGEGAGRGLARELLKAGCVIHGARGRGPHHHETGVRIPSPHVVIQGALGL
eukprot:scaffold518_cov388-Prasinococcus_capsulatus_cf.AAC.26